MKNVCLKLAVCAAVIAFAGLAMAQDPEPMSITLLSQQTSDLFPDGNPYYTGIRSVNVNWLDIPPEEMPETGWQSETPLTHDITGDPGVVTIYAWAKDTGDQLVADASDTIGYSTAAGVTITNIVAVPDANSIQLAWDTIDTAEDFVDTAGWLAYRRSGDDEWKTAGSPVHFFTHEMVISNLIDSTDYEIVLYSNDAFLNYPLTTGAADTTTGNVTWSGAAEPDWRWSIGYNWAGLKPPANPTAATITFGADGTSGEFSKLLAPIIEAEPESGVPADT